MLAVCPWALHSAVHASAGRRSRTGSQTRQKRRHAIAARRLPQPKNVISTAFPRWSPTSPIGPPYRDPYVGAPLRPWGNHWAPREPSGVSGRPGGSPRENRWIYMYIYPVAEKVASKVRSLSFDAHAGDNGRPALPLLHVRTASSSVCHAAGDRPERRQDRNGSRLPCTVALCSMRTTSR